jgi:hypothetical protein
MDANKPAPSPHALAHQIRHLAGIHSPGEWNNGYVVDQMFREIEEAAENIHDTTAHGSKARDVAISEISHWLYHNSIYVYIKNMHAATWRTDFVWGVLQVPFVASIAGLMWSDAKDIRLPVLVLLGVLLMLILARYIAGYYYLYRVPSGLKAPTGPTCGGCNGFDQPADPKALDLATMVRKADALAAIM